MHQKITIKSRNLAAINIQSQNSNQRNQYRLPQIKHRGHIVLLSKPFTNALVSPSAHGELFIGYQEPGLTNTNKNDALGAHGDNGAKPPYSGHCREWEWVERWRAPGREP